MYDTLPNKLSQEEMQPGDLVFVEGRYFEKHNRTPMHGDDAATKHSPLREVFLCAKFPRFFLAVSLVREAGIPGQSDNLISPTSRHCSCGNLDWAWAEWEGYDWCTEAGVSRFDASRNQINQMHLMNFVCSPRGVAVISRLHCLCFPRRAMPWRNTTTTSLRLPGMCKGP